MNMFSFEEKSAEYIAATNFHFLLVQSLMLMEVHVQILSTSAVLNRIFYNSGTSFM